LHAVRVVRVAFLLLGENKRAREKEGEKDGAFHLGESLWTDFVKRQIKVL